MGALSSRRGQPPFYPVQRETWPVRLFTGIERLVKGRLFGCRMCGTCILSETAFVVRRDEGTIEVHPFDQGVGGQDVEAVERGEA